MNTDIFGALYIVFEVFAVYIIISAIFNLFKLSSTSGDVRKIYKKKLLSNVVLLGIIVIVYLVNSVASNTFGTTSRSGSPNTAYMGGGLRMPNPYPQNPTTNLNDTREFLKKSFSASLQTRNVEKVAKQTELLIKGSGGRIDNSNVATKYAYYSFIIPKSELDSFEVELRTYTNAKLYTQSISSQNLLDQKINIENGQQKTAEEIKKLADQKAKVQASYKATASSLNSRITANQSQLRSVQVAISQTTDSQTKANLQSDEQSLIAQIQSLQNDLNQKTAIFKSEMSNLGVSLADQNNMLENLGTQEDQFFDNIETVQGNVSIQYISLWDLFTKLSPVNPIILIAIIITVFKIMAALKRDKTMNNSQVITQM